MLGNLGSATVAQHAPSHIIQGVTQPESRSSTIKQWVKRRWFDLFIAFIFAIIAGPGLGFLLLHIHDIPSIEPYRLEILYASTSLGVFCSVFLYVRLLNSHRVIRNSRAVEDKYNEIILHSARYQKCERIFRSVATQNALCDKNIFDNLNAFINHSLNKPSALSFAISKVESNLQYLLDATCKLCQAYTGYNCAASIKIIYSVNGDHDLKRANLKTVVRDPDSEGERGDDDGTIYNVQDNTAFEDIILHRRPYFASNDLQSLKAEGKYNNSHRGWEKLYNSTIVIGIPALQSNEFGINITGLLFVDSLNGKLDTPHVNTL
jgi:hypothetical protein